MADSDREEIAKLETLFTAHPEGRIFTHLAEAYRKAGELDRAREVLNRGLERHAEYSSAYVVLGRVQVDQGDTTAARASFRRVLELDAHNLVALRALGDLARDAGDVEEALGFYEQLQGVEPGNEELKEQVAALRAQRSVSEERTVAEPAAGAATADAAPPPFEPMDLTIGEAPGDALEEDGGFLSFETPDTSTLDLSGMTFAEPEDARDFEPISEAEPEPTLEPAAGFDAAPEPAAESGPPAAESFDAASESEYQPERESEPEPAIEREPEPAAGFFERASDSESFSPLETAEVSRTESEGPVVVTETIADLYMRQGLRERAAEVYRRLLQERPGDAELERKLAEAERAGPVEAAKSAERLETDFEIQRDEPGEVEFPEGGEEPLLTEEQEQAQLAESIGPDPVVASSMEGYFEELFGQIPPDVAAARAEAAGDEAATFDVPEAGESGKVDEPGTVEETAAPPPATAAPQPDWEALAGSIRWDPPQLEPETDAPAPLDAEADFEPLTAPEADFEPLTSPAPESETELQFEPGPERENEPASEPDAGPALEAGSEFEAEPEVTPAAAAEGESIDAPASDPWIEAAAEDELADDPQLEHIEAAWTGGAGALGTEPTPYAWDARAAGQEEAEPEESVTDYLRGLLSWRPRTAPEAAADVGEPVSVEAAREEPEEYEAGEAADESPEQPARTDEFQAALISPDPEAQREPTSEGPPAEGAPDAETERTPAASAGEELDEIDALFSDAPVLQRPAVEPLAEKPAEAATAPSETAAEDEEEDLEVFRSWLQSLKH